MKGYPAQEYRTYNQGQTNVTFVEVVDFQKITYADFERYLSDAISGLQIIRSIPILSLDHNSVVNALLNAEQCIDGVLFVYFKVLIGSLVFALMKEGILEEDADEEKTYKALKEHGFDFAPNGSVKSYCVKILASLKYLYKGLNYIKNTSQKYIVIVKDVEERTDQIMKKLLNRIEAIETIKLDFDQIIRRKEDILELENFIYHYENLFNYKVKGAELRNFVIKNRATKKIKLVPAKVNNSN